MIIGIAIGLAAAAGVVLLIWFISKGGVKLTPLWAVLFVLSLAFLWTLWNIVGVYYHLPVGWMVALGAAALVVVAFFVMVGKSVSWKWQRVLATLLLGLAGFVFMTLVLMALPFGNLMTPLFEVRGQQIAEDAGFELLVPAGHKLVLDYLPVEAIAGAEGVNMRYEGFELQERKADGDATIAKLRTVLAAGEDPLGFQMKIPSDATYEELEVDGTPALGVEFTLDERGKPSTQGGLPGKQSVIRILAFSRDGVDVRIKAEGNMAYQGGIGENERYEYQPPLEFSELVEVAESLEPAE